MNDKGLVAAFTGVRKPFQLREFPVTQPEPGTILVEVRMANVCGSDLHIWRGEYDVSRGQSEPFCLSIGHEMVGRIAALGEGVTQDLGRRSRCASAIGWRISIFVRAASVAAAARARRRVAGKGTALSLAADRVGRISTPPTDSTITSASRRPSSKCRTTCPTCWPGRPTAHCRR